MIGVSGRGPWPAHDPLEAQLAVFEKLGNAPDGVLGIPFIPQLAARGPGADDVGRAATFLTDVPVEFGPHGWRLADHQGIDLSRALEFRRQDLDALEISGAGFSGPLTIQLYGPWTLAASLFLARGDRVLSDRGAVHDLTQALTHGVAQLVGWIRDRVPGAELLLQLDEHLLGQVNVGAVPTFSGYSTLRAVTGPDLVAGLRGVLDATRDLGVMSVVHVGRTWSAIPVLALAGADAVGVQLDPWNENAWNENAWGLLARAIERGLDLWPGFVDLGAPSGARARADVESVLTPWRRIGLAERDLNRLVLTSASSAPPDLPALIRVAQVLAERANN